ncbi:MAG TPA: hypothetical protein PK772_02920 [Chitinophagaceae bacterium]|nr:hypothetical protein [Chitinophagaceae bacterium]
MKSFNAILQELENISPVVANIQKQNVWSVPICYFDSILPAILNIIKNDSYININEVAEELKTISPLLASLSKASILSIPENYFDDNVYNNQHKIISINNRKKKKYIWLAAASVALLVALGLNQWLERNVQRSGIDEIALAEKLDKIDEQSLIAYVDNNSIAEMSIYNTTTSTNWDMDINEAFKQIDANEIKEYVMENEHLVEVNNE